MNSFSISASYTKNEHSSEMKPAISNTVNVSNTITPTSSSSTTDTKIEPIVEISTDVKPAVETSKILPPKNILKSANVITNNKVLNERSEFERKLLSVCLHVLSSQNKTLINNIIDVSGDIILAHDDLIELIKIATGESKISFMLDDRARSGCLKKLPIWSPIVKIIVADTDFEICYNKIYVMFAEYKVSLKKVVIG